ncbi:riboflavin synthase [Hanstruepera flava]|uniref:riboflavin synthase n=1 Tax=Hanstruepera flava TaxID=2930218 RepID=UPI0020292124|nr:riboflavin synthase [Hanstruepera flava]
MFTGIIETIGKVKELAQDQSNVHLTIESDITPELKIDQSVAHNGVCLTVVSIKDKLYTVTAIEETLAKTNLNSLVIGDSINLERAMKLGDRLDGHIVQGHVDQTAICEGIESSNGSWVFTFSYDETLHNITIEKGSITVNGVSLTVVNSKASTFSVAIVPYTYEHTTFKHLKIGSIVNLEFDVVGKYVKKLFELNK